MDGKIEHRRADHAQAAARGHQRGLRPDEARRVDPLGGRLLMAPRRRGQAPRRRPRGASEHACFGGVQGFYRHDSAAVGLPMRFGVYLPPQAAEAGARLPLLVFLAGLTCTEETFAIKAGAQRVAAELGLVLRHARHQPARRRRRRARPRAGTSASAPASTSTPPRRRGRRHWRMESWLVDELLPLAGAHLPVDLSRTAVFGHSMGGHGALTLALRHPGAVPLGVGASRRSPRRRAARGARRRSPATSATTARRGRRTTRAS